jgi:hypothetical protein
LESGGARAEIDTTTLVLGEWGKLVILSEGELVVFVVLAMCRSEAIGALLIAK